jgi:SNF2 family DNA or RNA helicase
MTAQPTTETSHPITATLSADGTLMFLHDVPFVMKNRIDHLKPRWNAIDRAFTLPFTWGNCIGLRSALGDDLILDPHLDEVAYQFISEVTDLRKYRSAHGRTVPEHDLPGFDILFAHQRTAADLILRSWRVNTTYGVSPGARYIILDHLGTGKTQSSLAGLALIEEAGGDIGPVMIVCPKSVVRAWVDTIPTLFPEREVREVTGPATKVRAALAPGAFAYVISYDTLRRYSRISGYAGATPLTPDQRLDKEVQAIGVKSLIVDEAHRIKNPKALQSRAVWHVADEADNVIALTGTPLQDSPEDLWSVLHAVDSRQFPTMTSYRDRFLEMEWNPFGGMSCVGLNPLTREEFLSIFHAMSRRAEKSEVLPFLPPKVYSIRWVTLPVSMLAAYRQMAREYWADFGAEGVLSADNAMVAAGRLIQMANSTLRVTEEEDDKVTVEMIEPSPKIAAFLEDLDAGDYDGRSVVVFSDSRKLLRLLEAAFAKRGIEYGIIAGDIDTESRNWAIKQFQSGKIKFIFLTRAGDSGITLTAASVMVRLTRAWSLTTHEQAEDRVHRIGSEVHDSIEYIDYVTEGTLEVGQIARLNDKSKRASDILSARELHDLIETSTPEVSKPARARKAATP